MVIAYNKISLKSIVCIFLKRSHSRQSSVLVITKLNYFSLIDLSPFSWPCRPNALDLNYFSDSIELFLTIFFLFIQPSCAALANKTNQNTSLIHAAQCPPWRGWLLTEEKERGKKPFMVSYVQGQGHCGWVQSPNTHHIELRNKSFFSSFILTNTYRNMLAAQHISYPDMLQKTKVSIDFNCYWGS